MNPTLPAVISSSSRPTGDQHRRTLGRADGHDTVGKRPPRAARGGGDRDALVETVIEQVCARGCKAVYQVIAGLQARRIPDEMTELSSIECERVLMELESIMAVYAENGSACLVGDS